MKQQLRQAVGWLPWLVLVLGMPAMAGPLYDPFLERFQVGVYSDPDEISLRDTFPADLLDLPQLDRSWVTAAIEALDHDTSLTRRMLALNDDSALLDQLTDAVAALHDKEFRRGYDVTVDHYLGPEILVLQVFDALAAGDTLRATQEAERLAAAPGLSDWNERAAFVWELRARKLAGRPGKEFWNSPLALGPFDKGSAWALWVAHRRARKLSPLGADWSGEPAERFLASLRKGWLRPRNLYDSGFSPEAQAALGAHLLTGQDRRDHLKRFGHPPADHRRQGLWVKGARFARRGQVDAYEKLALRKDLRSGWRMDIWRRSSELRFLAGDDKRGMADLKRALDLARWDAGPLALRRRLRQWCEQAMVLAVARRDTTLARKIHGLAATSFRGEEAEVFEDETAYWSPLWNEAPPEPAPSLKARSLRIVESGQSPALQRPDAARMEVFARACDRTRWEWWRQWGLAWIADAQLGATDRALADRYATALRKPEGPAMARACAAVALGGTEIWPRMIQASVEYDVARERADRGPAAASVVPDVLPLARGSRLRMHALLGFCLMIDDLRGVLGTATELPARGISEEERMRFLYPLPGPGPIREAIAESGADPALVLAIARNESLFEPNVRSRAGALGFMQIMPFHYESSGAIPGDRHWSRPEVSISRGARILADDGRRYDGDPYLTVAAYNAGPGAAQRWLDQLGGIAARDIYLAWIGYPETRRYVEKVLIDREIYDWIIASDSGTSATNAKYDNTSE